MTPTTIEGIVSFPDFHNGTCVKGILLGREETGRIVMMAPCIGIRWDRYAIYGITVLSILSPRWKHISLV